MKVTHEDPNKRYVCPECGRGGSSHISKRKETARNPPNRDEKYTCWRCGANFDELIVDEAQEPPDAAYEQGVHRNRPEFVKEKIRKERNENEQKAND